MIEWKSVSGKSWPKPIKAWKLSQKLSLSIEQNGIDAPDLLEKSKKIQTKNSNPIIIIIIKVENRKVFLP